MPGIKPTSFTLELLKYSFYEFIFNGQNEEQEQFQHIIDTVTYTNSVLL